MAFTVSVIICLKRHWSIMMENYNVPKKAVPVQSGGMSKMPVTESM